MSENKVLDVILHCQKQIKKEPPEEKLLHYLGRLSRLRITVQDLAETGIGRTVNQLSRNEGPVGSAAETLVRGWKRMVSEQQSQAEGGSEESDSNSNSESSEDEEEEEDELNTEDVPYDIQEQEEVAVNQEQQYRNGHPSNEERRELTEPVALQSKTYGDADEDDDDIDDVDDPYIDNGYLNIANVHTDEEEEEDDDDNDSDTSDRLQIADDAERNERKEDTYPKHDKHYNNISHQSEENRDHKSSHSKIHHRSHESSEKKHISSSSKLNPYSERSEKASSSSSKDPKQQSAKSHNFGEPKERLVIKQEQTLDHKSHPHPSSSSKSEKLKEYKSESSSSDRSHHKEKDRHRHDKHSRESSSHREKDGKSEKERQKDKKDSSDHHRSSSHHRKDKNREASSSSHSPKKSSLEIKKPESSEDRKRRDNSEPPASSSSKKSKLELKEEIDSTSGVNFADVLGSLDTSSKHKKPKKEEVEKPHKKNETHTSSSQSHKLDHHKKHHSPSSSKHSRESSSSSSKKYERDSEVTKMIKKPVHGKIESVIKPVVTISPNYKPTSSSFPSTPRPGSSNGHSAPLPLPQIDLSDLGSTDYAEPTIGRTSSYNPSQEDAISTMLSSRNARSKVYSGVKTGRRGAVPTLFDLCMQVIKDNIGDLGYTGGIPYDILRPALERANPQQLMNIEAQNDYLIGETDELWQFHCKRDFRGKCPEETESWRELYERCTDEQKRKFEQIKKQMKRSIESAEPVRKAKLAFVDTSSGPRFSKQKAQTIKNGMRTLKMKEEKGPKRGVSSSASVGFNNPKGSGEGNVVLEEAIIIAAESRAGHAPAPSVSRESSSAAKFAKPKKAPLMQKTMKLIRSLNRR